MKKVTYLLTIMFAVALMSTSCCKDDPVVPDPVGITEGDLGGMWTFQSLNYLGVDYDYDLNSLELADLNEDLDYIQFDLNFVSETEVNIYMDYIGDNVTDAGWDYYSQWDEYLLFELVVDVIKIPHIDLELKIMNADSFDENSTVIELELLGTNLQDQYVPLNGVFTLTK